MVRQNEILAALLLLGAVTVGAKPQQAATTASGASSSASAPASDRPPVLENPAYDPTMYHQFLPQDAVQQYVQSYTGPNYHQNHPTAVGTSYGSQHFDPSGFAAIPAKGFETYLAIPATNSVVQESHSPSLFGSVRDSVIPSARSVVGFFGQLAQLVLGSAGAVVLGTVLTSLLCFFTPFCTLSFRNAKLIGSGVGETVQEVMNAVGEQVTAERVKRAAEFVQVAIDKFQQLNAVVREASERKAAAAAARGQ